MKIPPPGARRKARIEIIPLIDIIFFLLATFVMVSLSMVKNKGVPVRLPSAATAAGEDRASSTTVTISADGGLYLDKEPLPLEGLKDRLKARQAEDAGLKVFINGDERASFGRAVEVLDEIRSAGITRVAIQARSRE